MGLAPDEPFHRLVGGAHVVREKAEDQTFDPVFQNCGTAEMPEVSPLSVCCGIQFLQVLGFEGQGILQRVAEVGADEVVKTFAVLSADFAGKVAQ